MTTALCLMVGAGLSCEKKTQETAPDAAVPSVSTNAAEMNSAGRPEFAKLQGKWLRPDGGYVLEIKSVDAQGNLTATYLNPNPIHVSKALAMREQSETKVFVELRDVNYPGCTYSLKYDPATDQLYGQYFQAAAQQTYDITFERLKE